MSNVVEGSYVSTALLIRRLPLGTTSEAVRTMLLFASDLQDIEILSNEFDEDSGFTTAIARFSTIASASEVQLMLDGKPNTDGKTSMIVTITQPYQNGMRRNTIDPSAGIAVHTSSPRSRMIRYNGGFDSMNRLSPPPSTSPQESALSDGGQSLNGVLQAQSPRSNGHPDWSRISGKSVIGEDDGDDETNGLIRDPLGYMRKDNPAYRQMPVDAFNRLSLQTEMPSKPQYSNYTTPRLTIPQYSARSPFSPGAQYIQGQGQFSRGHHFPPVNPADQNPPCNTLYVGNLPMDTSEDELKSMFSKQRGYKRLCFRTKQNGPMCFVEFEDISFATKALNELYGAQLHNSVKGGIRLSFSKNPLGVRSGQTGNNTGPSTPISMTHSNMINGMQPMSPGSFQNNGPPPGLSAPPGFNAGSGPLPPFYQSNMRNRDHRTPSEKDGYSDYMLGR